MKLAAIYMLEVLACSGVLLAAYAILLERRVKFRWCRLYLLLITAVAALIPLLRIPVWPGRVLMATPAITVPDLPDWGAEVLPDNGAGRAMTPEIFCAGLYLLGAALIIGVMLWQVVRMRRLRRGAVVSQAGGYTLVRTRQEIASFSFFRTIYIWDTTPAQEMGAIVAHESSHIAHRHSVERILMELQKALLWWNPFVWIAARRLTEAEEFEADNDVLSSGYDRADYMQTIFKQLFGYSPEIANGLRNSLTKKRFKMMTTQTKSRHSLLRLAGTLPAVIGLLCAFSFTTRAAVIVAPAADPTTGTMETPGDTQTAADKQDKTQKVLLTVQDEKKRPIAGAVVQLLGTKKGSVTGKDGRAEIKAPAGSKLAVSYPDYEARTIDVDEGIAIAVVSLVPERKAGNATAGNTPAAAENPVNVRVIVYKDTTPLAGALVRVSRSQQGAVTDDRGHAAMNVPANALLEISYIGCEPQVIQVGEKGNEAHILSLKAEEPSSVHLTDAPLILVNGIEMESMDNIDPNTVESISIIKQGADVAKYGPKARNGMIVIKLKDTAGIANGSVTVKDNKIEKEEAFLVAETMPQFPTGDDTYGDLNDFRTWVQNRVKYPAEALDKCLQGRVVLSFVVETDGSVSNIVKLQSPDESLWEEARRVIAASPKWKPGEQRGQIVRVKYTLPVDFRLTTPAAPATPAASADNSQDEPFLVAETMPSFDGGGIPEFRKWVQMHVRYPAEALSQNVYGRVVASFVVGKDGSVGSIEILQSPHASLSDEVRRVIASAPEWTPGKQRGQDVRVKLTLPIEFAVSSENGVHREQAATPKGSLDEVLVVGYGTAKKAGGTDEESKK